MLSKCLLGRKKITLGRLPFKELLATGLPSWEPIKLGTVGNYRLKEAQGRESEDVLGVCVVNWSQRVGLATGEAM